jgi:CheY-like chemotaxis protein
MSEQSNVKPLAVGVPKVLIADDDPVALRIMQKDLGRWGYEVLSVTEGLQADKILRAPESPRLALLDWNMPGMDGLEIVRRVRRTEREIPTYIILLTATVEKKDLVEGLKAGADDFLTKPYDRGELEARLNVGARMVELQERLAARVRQLEVALSEVKQLSGLLPICSYCKKIRNDGSYWEQLESYICKRSDAHFTHGICPDCYQRVTEEEFEADDETPIVHKPL